MKKAYILSCIVAGLLALVLVAPLVVRLASGGFYMTVTGTSMKPTYEVGDVLLVRPTVPASVHIGDIVVARFAGSTGHKSLYVHRVVARGDDSWTLRGDNNKQADPVPIRDDQIVGSPAFAMTHGFGEIFTFTQNIFGRIFIGTMFVLLISAPAIYRWLRGGVADDAEKAGASVPS